MAKGQRAVLSGPRRLVTRGWIWKSTFWDLSAQFSHINR